MNALFNAQLTFYLLTWMFHSRELNNKINRMHEKYLPIVYNDSISSYEKFLEIGNSISVHHRNM